METVRRLIVLAGLGSASFAQSYGYEIMEKHKIYALILSVITCVILVIRDGIESSVVPGLYIALWLLGIMFYNFLANIAGFGFWESFARDRGLHQEAAPYAFLFWLLLLGTCIYFLIFK